MSVQQVENFRKVRAVLKELAAFGLNPQQWRISRLKDTQQDAFTIYHLDDEDFRMRGSLQQQPSGAYRVGELQVVGF